MTARLEELEEELGLLRSRVRKLESNHKEDEIETQMLPQLEEEAPVIGPSKPFGRPPLVSEDELKRRLRALLWRLEVFWPEFEEAIDEAADADSLGALLVQKCPGRENEHVFEKIFAHRKEMWEFVTGDRFDGTAERLACALAGVPEMKVRSSFDRCFRLLPLDRPG